MVYSAMNKLCEKVLRRCFRFGCELRQTNAIIRCRMILGMEPSLLTVESNMCIFSSFWQELVKEMVEADVELMRNNPNAWALYCSSSYACSASHGRGIKNWDLIINCRDARVWLTIILMRVRWFAAILVFCTSLTDCFLSKSQPRIMALNSL